ncbi:MAG: MATE family efflux transporter [Lachnospiraceae bacterium]|uniref:MATE family efflux transporter n=1 Tax=Candidatus Weimeria bifida TaxID=2599074 RepID=A0A6N7J382_9FIRM|nr:MATE family efflux transporter [Candidatus Weimeria bifida]RRF97434.1 MAG: MATE family efflux transporter [Lachnospiraceae bacterium]
MTKSMTEGAILPQIVKFSIPLLLGNIVQQTYNFIDAMIVGRTLGADALGAVGASSSVQFLVLGLCIGTCIGFGVPVAQRFGANDLKNMRRFIYNSWVLTAIMMVVITALTALLCNPILMLLKTPKSIYHDAYWYLLIIFLGIPATLAYNLLSSVLRAVGDSTTPFIFLLFSAVLNIFLDLFCILVLHLGVPGAALATIASQAVSALLCYFYQKKKFKILTIQEEEKGFDKKKALKLLYIGLPMGLQYSITAIGSMVEQSGNNSLGAVYTSAFSAAYRIKQMAMCPFDAVASAVSTFVGQNYGARNGDRIKKGIRQGVVLGVSYGILIGLVLIFFGRYMSMALISDTGAKTSQILDASAELLRYNGIFFWLLGILNVVRLAVQALGYSNLAIVSGVTEMVARSVTVIGFVPLSGYRVICFTDPIAWIFATAYSALICIYVTGKIAKRLKAEKGRPAVMPS